MSEGGDVGILNFALTLEYLESAFYEEAKKRAKPSGELKSLVDLLAEDEKQHVEALTATIKQLGGKPVAEAEVRLPLQRHGRLPEAGADLRGHRGQRLQRRRALDQVERRARLGRRDRPGRGPARGGDPPPEQAGTVPRGLRPLARRSEGAQGCGTVYRVKPERLADEELMPLIAARDPDALEVVYDRHGGAAYSLAYRIVGERAAAEDVVQEAFISIWRSGARYDRARGSVRSWMLGIVRNRAIDLLRSKTGRAPLDFDDDAILEQRVAGERTEEEALQRETADEVRGAIGELPRRPVEGDRARLLRRLQPLGDRRDAGRAPGHRQGPDAARVGEDAERAGGGTGMSEADHTRWKDDVAAYVLGALEPERGGGAGAPPRGLRRVPRRAALAAARRRPAPERSSGSSRRRSCAPRSSTRPARSRGRGRRARAARARPPRRLAQRLAPGRRGSGVVALMLAAVAGYAIRGGDSAGGDATTVAAGKPPAVTAKLVMEGDSGDPAPRQRRRDARGQGPRGLGAARRRGRPVRRPLRPRPRRAGRRRRSPTCTGSKR